MKISDDQREVQSAVRRVFEERVTPDYRREWIARRRRSDSALAAVVEELGLVDGFSGDSPVFGAVELGLIAFEAGRVLLPEPICERVGIAYVASRALSDSDRDAFMTAVGPGATPSIAPARCCGLKLVNGKVSGQIAWQIGAEGASCLIAHAESKEGRRAVVVNGVDLAGSVVPSTSIDLTTPLAMSRFDGVPVSVLSGEASCVLEASLECVWAAMGAGLCSRVIELTSEFLRTREQFGVPIGGFQALQQKLASAYAESESLRALSSFASWSFDNDPSQRLLTASTAAANAALVCPAVCESAVQCHGGIGFTWEYDLHLYLRRAKLIEAAFPLDVARAKLLCAQAQGRAA